MNTRRDRFGGMDRFFEQFDRMMGDWRDLQFDTPALGTGSGIRTERVDDAIHVLADLPGFEREMIDLRYHDEYLTISATREESDDTFARRREANERIHIPGEIDADNIAATYRNGVLEVTLPLVDSEDDVGTEIHIE